jgi:hypothetical protein
VVVQLALNTREQRLAETQRAFRIANERLGDALERSDGNEAIPFLCECMDDTKSSGGVTDALDREYATRFNAPR